MTFRAFDSNDELESYISSPLIGSGPDYDQVCFGFKVIENDSKNKYELELFFNDLRPRWLETIPSQKEPYYNAYVEQ